MFKIEIWIAPSKDGKMNYIHPGYWKNHSEVLNEEEAVSIVKSYRKTGKTVRAISENVEIRSSPMAFYILRKAVT
jgi:hypothetical protein